MNIHWRFLEKETFKYNANKSTQSYYDNRDADPKNMASVHPEGAMF